MFIILSISDIKIDFKTLFNFMITIYSLIMYSSIETIHFNNQKYYVYKKVLEEYHYFDTIIQGKFQDKTIDFEFNIAIDFNIVLDFMMAYHYVKNFDNTNINELNFNDMINLLNILTYLLPKDQNLFTELINSYRIKNCDNYKDMIITVNRSNMNNNHKVEILKKIIHCVNKVDLVLNEGSDDLKIDVEEDKDNENDKWQQYLKIPNIPKFFEQFDIIIDSYEIPIETRCTKDCWGMRGGNGEFMSDTSDELYNPSDCDSEESVKEIKDNKEDPDKDLIWFDGNSRGYYTEDYAPLSFRIDGNDLPLIDLLQDIQQEPHPQNKKANVYSRFDLTKALTNFIIKRYLV